MAGYDPKKAAEYNRLIQQGVAPEAAIAQSGITFEEQGNYEINAVGNSSTNNDYGKMSDIAVGQSKTSGISDSAPSTSPAPIVPQTESVFNPAQDPTESVFDPGQTYNGPASSESVFDPRQDPAESVFDPGQTYNGPASGESVFDPRQDIGESVFDPGQTYNGPAASESVFDPRQDIGESVFDPAAAVPNPEVAKAASVNNPYYGLTPTQLKDLGGADPTDPYIRARLGIPQLPGSTLNATPGFGTIKTGVPAIDSALGIIGGGITSLFSNFASTVGGLFGSKPTATAAAATTGSGVAGLTAPAPTPATSSTTVTPASDPSQFPAYDDNGNLQPGFKVNPETGQTYFAGYAGNANNASESVFDPRQDPGENVFDPGQTYNGPASSESVFDPRQDPTESIFDPGATYNGPATSESVFDPRQDPGENIFDPGATYNGPATSESVFDPRQDATESIFDPGQTFNAGGESVFNPVAVDTGETMSVAGLTAKGINTTTLSTDQADAFYNGTGTLTAEQRLAQDQKTAADAAVLYPGTNNEALRQIDIGAGRIAENTVGIANAEQIIAANNAELSDPNISDARRAELEANNVSQQEYIQAATENSLIQENVIEQNANVYAAGGGNPGDGQTPDQVAALTDPGIQENVFDPGVGQPQSESVFDPTQDVGEQVFDPGETFNANDESVFDPANIELNSDPFEQARYDAQLALDNEEPAEFAPEDVPVMTDAEADALAEQQAENQRILAEQATEVEPGADPGENVFDPGQTFNAGDESVFNPADVDAEQGGLELPPGAEEDGPPQEEPYALNPDEDDAISQQEGGAAEGAMPLGSEESFQGAQQAAVLAKAKQQATIQARYKQQSNSDWRFRLSLSPNAKYLYNAGDPGILQPLAATDGVIFPYTPSVTTTYSANYEQYDLVHSNYRGVFYKNSRVGDIQIRGTFTAQDTREAAYLLAVVHFFRSATKMFYGQDAERGTPPPICLLNGLGQYQFSDHPVLITSFNYTLPNDVDYIRTTSANNFGPNMSNRNVPSKSNPNGSAVAGVNRLLNALLPKGALPQIPAPNNLIQNVSNTAAATYVPTKMEIDITCIPVQTRSQVSNQFSLKGFANGDLLKGGFW